jgi:hypothetical protein
MKSRIDMKSLVQKYVSDSEPDTPDDFGKLTL